MTQKNTLLDNELTIFVNTSDNFEDCWDAFFKLFATFWPDCPFPIVLNTESKDYAYPGLNIHCTKVAQGEKRRLGWSECLMRALDGIHTPYILYLQEDYFLEDSVRQDVISKLLGEIKSGNIAAIRLSGTDGIGPFYPAGSPLVFEVDKKAKWRLSLQAALWNKAILRSLVRKHESPWQLESYGSFRTRGLREKICCVAESNDKFDNGIFPYRPTGVVAGRWVREIVEPLFHKHHISVDYTKRGFHSNIKRTKKRKFILARVWDRIRSAY